MIGTSQCRWMKHRNSFRKKITIPKMLPTTYKGHLFTLCIWLTIHQTLESPSEHSVKTAGKTEVNTDNNTITRQNTGQTTKTHTKTGSTDR